MKTSLIRSPETGSLQVWCSSENWQWVLRPCGPECLSRPTENHLVLETIKLNQSSQLSCAMCYNAKGSSVSSGAALWNGSPVRWLAFPGSSHYSWDSPWGPPMKGFLKTPHWCSVEESLPHVLHAQIHEANPIGTLGRWRWGAQSTFCRLWVFIDSQGFAMGWLEHSSTGRYFSS